MGEDAAILDGKVAVVTGSSSGNGRAIALALAGAGATVVCSDIQVEPRPGGYESGGEVTPTDELIRERGGEARFVQADVSSVADVAALAAAAAEVSGRLDIWVNNAGIATSESIVEETEEKYERMMAINAKGPYLGCKFAISQMLKQEPVDKCRGRIVNMSSINGLVGYPNEPSYCMAKGAVILLTKALALDYASQWINVNAICPGFIETAMLRKFLEQDADRAEVEASTPWPELGTTEDVGQAALYLVSPASRFVTGSALTIDGGYTAL